MDKILVRGGMPLSGSIPISGAKNAALPLLAAALLVERPVRLANLPDLADIASMTLLLQELGARVDIENGDERCAVIDAAGVDKAVAPYDIVRKMRASVLVLGPLLARFGEAQVSLPGGCAIGTRPVDLHIRALERLGAEIELADGYIQARAPRGLSGGEIRFPMVSVGATENALMAAVLAQGETRIENAAREPEVNDLARLLVAMGARIEGIGTDELLIEGVPVLNGTEHRVVPDRIEAATYAMATAVAGGEVVLQGAEARHLHALVGALVDVGMTVEPLQNGLRVARNGKPVHSIDVMTAPYPGFPTDAQAQLMALMCRADGTSVIQETIFENRFMHVPELARMGADISVRGNTAVVRGVEELRGAPVMATDLRASVSLVLAGLAAKGETVVNRVYHLDRGYERLVEKLAAAGADIERVQE